MVQFNPDAAAKTVTYTVRNDRSYYPDDKKPSVDTVLQDALKGGYAKMETSKYYAYGNEANIPSTVETYYAADGSVVAKKTHVHNEQDAFHPGEHVSIHTPTADYNDWDNDGKVDSKDVDRTYTRPVQQEEFDEECIKPAKFVLEG